MRKGKGRRPLAQRCERLGQEMAVERRQGFASPGSRPLARHGSDSPAAILYEYRLAEHQGPKPMLLGRYRAVHGWRQWRTIAIGQGGWWVGVKRDRSRIFLVRDVGR
jgi:hypothetical protein